MRARARDRELPTLRRDVFLATHQASVDAILGPNVRRVYSRGDNFYNRDHWPLRHFTIHFCAWVSRNRGRKAPPTMADISEMCKKSNEVKVHNPFIVIAATPSELRHSVAMALMGGAYHEAWHTKYSRRAGVVPSVMKPLIDRVWSRIHDWSRLGPIINEWANIVEDIRIERCGNREYPGADQKMCDLQDFILDKEYEGKMRAVVTTGRDYGSLFPTQNVISAVFRDVGLGYDTPRQLQAWDEYNEHNPDAVKFVTEGPLSDLLRETIALGPQADIACFRIAMEVIATIHEEGQDKQDKDDQDDQDGQGGGQDDKAKCPNCGSPKVKARPLGGNKALLVCDECGYQDEIELADKSKGQGGGPSIEMDGDDDNGDGDDADDSDDNDDCDDGSDSDGSDSGNGSKSKGKGSKSKGSKNEDSDGSDDSDGDSDGSGDDEGGSDENGGGSGDEDSDEDGDDSQDGNSSGKSDEDDDAEGDDDGKGGGSGDEDDDGDSEGSGGSQDGDDDADGSESGEGDEDDGDGSQDGGNDTSDSDDGSDSDSGGSGGDSDGDDSDSNASGKTDDGGDGAGGYAKPEERDENWKPVADAFLDSAETGHDAGLMDANTALGDEVQGAKEAEQEDVRHGEIPFQLADNGQNHVVFVGGPRGSLDESARTLLDSVRSECSYLRARLRSIILAVAQTHIEHGTRTGKLSQRMFVEDKAALMAGRMPGRPYYDTEEQIDTSLAAAIVIDESSSMSGRKLTLATQAMMAITEPLDALGYPVMALGFQNGWSPEVDISQGDRTAMRDIVQIDVFKTFGESFQSVRWRFAATQANGSTPMANGVQYGLECLVDREETHKILFIVTDGQPDLNHRPRVKWQIRKAREAGIHVIGVGIGSGASYVKGLFPDHVHVSNLTDLPAALLRKLNQLLDFRGLRTPKNASRLLSGR